MVCRMWHGLCSITKPAPVLLCDMGQQHTFSGSFLSAHVRGDGAVGCLRGLPEHRCGEGLADPWAWGSLLPHTGVMSGKSVCWKGLAQAPHMTGWGRGAGLTKARASLPTVQDQSCCTTRHLENQLQCETCNSLPRYLTPSRSGKKKKSKRKSVTAGWEV